ncbi:MAG: ATP-binding protein [Boseongicola sp.]|nr:ATP-binding protein [Boseongicola sp.]
MSETLQSDHTQGRSLKLYIGVLASVLVLGISAYLFLGQPDISNDLNGPSIAAGMSSLVFTYWIIRALNFYQRRNHLALAEKLLNSESTPGFVTNSKGEILLANQSGRENFHASVSDSLEAALKTQFADASGIVQRGLTGNLERSKSVSPLLGDTGWKTTATEIGSGLWYWRFSPPSSQVAKQSLGIPIICGTETTGWRALTPAAERAFDEMKTVFGGKPSLQGHHPVTIASQGPEETVAYVANQIRKVSGNSRLHSVEQLVDGLPVPLLKISKNGDVLSANELARNLLELEAEELPPLYELVEGMGRPISEWLADAGVGRGLLKSEFVRATTTSKELYLQITLGKVDTPDAPFLIGILNDATELKTLEAQFVQSQKMQAIGQLAGGVAHDFNNLLTAINGHCDLLLLRHDENDPDYSDLMQIAQNSNRAASLVGQLLAFSRKQNLRPQSLDLRNTMSDLMHLLNRLVGEKITLDLQIENIDKVIRADRRQFEQVIMNLVVNARDAMKDGGTIGVRVQLDSLVDDLKRDRATVPAGHYIRVEVEDTGCGIDPDKMPKIFEPFYSTKKTGEGTGLGLSTAYGIVKQSGGYIFVDSKAGQGTLFTLYFPAHDRQLVSQHREEDVKPTIAPQPGDGVILLVEDEAPVRAFASRALRLRGYTVLEAENAEDALETLRDSALKVDVFVTDVIMPGLDGPSWVKQALVERPETRVVFVSGYAEESLAENQSRIPNSVFLAKPFSLTQLTTVVQEQLQ